MSKPIQTVEELGAVLHWRRKHALAIKDRDALQQRLTAADEALDKAEDEFSLMSLEAGQRIDLLESLLRDVYDHNELSLSDNQRIYAALKPAEGRGDEPKCLLCLDKKTVPSNLVEGYVMDCPDCCGEEG